MRHNQEFQAGIFIMLTLSLVAVTILALGRERHMFSTSLEYFTTFQDVKGLKEGAPVRLGGITIGQVLDIGFSDKADDSLVHVSLEIDSHYQTRLRKNSRTSIASQGLLGDRFVSISNGSGLELMEPKAYFQSEESGDIADILQTAGTIAQHVTSLSKTLDDILRDFRADSAENLKVTLSNTREITSALTEGDGLFHELLFAEYESTGVVQSFTTAIRKLETVVNALESGDGVLHNLIFENSDADKNQWLTGTLKEISVAAHALQKVLNQIETGEGVLHELLYTSVESGAEPLGARLKRIVTNLDEATTSLAKGGGTLGALLIDSTLYDNLVDVTDEAKRSYVLRSAIRATMEE